MTRNILHLTILVIFLSLQGYGQLQHASVNKIALTFDDLPATHGDYRYILEKLIDTLLHYRAPAIGFVNEIKLYDGGKLNEQNVALLTRWFDAGFELGNHTYSHISIDNASAAEYKNDIIKGEAVTTRILARKNKRIRYYRHPQLRTGPTTQYKDEIDTFLKSRHYEVAPVTVDNNDYIFANIYVRAKQKMDTATMRHVGELYLKYMEDTLVFFEELSTGFLGYNVRHTLLLHASDLNADYLGGLIRMMQQRNYHFISLAEALDDPAYRLDDAQTKRGLSWIHRWMLAKGLEMKEEPGVAEEISILSASYK